MKKLSQIINENTAEYLDDNFRLELIDMLQVALAEEFNAWYQYTIVCKFLKGVGRPDVEKFYEEAAKDEFEDHGMFLIERICQLGGYPDKLISPDNWNKTAEHKYITPEFTEEGDIILNDSLDQNISAEQGAIETYVKIEKFTRGIDQVTNSKIKEILKDEEEHLQSLLDFKNDIN